MRYYAVLFLVALFAFPSAAYSAKGMAKQIVLTETGEAKVMPTQGSLSFSQEIVVLLKQGGNSELTAKEAKSMLTKKVGKLTGAVKKDLQFAKSFTKDFEANVSFSPYYKRDDSQNKIVGYRARANYSITVLDLKKAQGVTQAVLKSGVEDVSQLYTQIDEISRRACEKEALKTAVERAKERAEVMAILMDGKLGGITSTVINSQGSPRMYMAKSMMESDANMYEAKESTCNVRVELVFAVK